MDFEQIIVNQISGMITLVGLVVWYMITGKSKWHYMMRQNRPKDMQKIIGMLILTGYALFIWLISATIMQGNSVEIMPEYGQGYGLEYVYGSW